MQILCFDDVKCFDDVCHQVSEIEAIKGSLAFYFKILKSKKKKFKEIFVLPLHPTFGTRNILKHPGSLLLTALFYKTRNLRLEKVFKK